MPHCFGDKASIIERPIHELTTGSNTDFWDANLVKRHS